VISLKTEDELTSFKSSYSAMLLKRFARGFVYSKVVSVVKVACIDDNLGLRCYGMWNRRQFPSQPKHTLRLPPT
jgi:hypothetical protein